MGEHIQYDTLNRLIVKDLPGGTANDVAFEYDEAGRPKWAKYVDDNGSGVVYSYGQAKRLTSEATFGRSVGFKLRLDRQPHQGGLAGRELGLLEFRQSQSGEQGLRERQRLAPADRRGSLTDALGRGLGPADSDLESFAPTGPVAGET